MTTLTDEQRDDIEHGVVTPHYVVDPVALAAALATIDAQRERIAALEAENARYVRTLAKHRDLLRQEES